MKTAMIVLLLTVTVSAQDKPKSTLDMLPSDAWRASYQAASGDAMKLRAWLAANSRSLRDPALASIQLDAAQIIVSSNGLKPKHGQPLQEVELAANARISSLGDVDAWLKFVGVRGQLPERSATIKALADDERAAMSKILERCKEIRATAARSNVNRRHVHSFKWRD